MIYVQDAGLSLVDCSSHTSKYLRVKDLFHRATKMRTRSQICFTEQQKQGHVLSIDMIQAY
jgi:hypothetical protein